MRMLDWAILVGSLVFIVSYGLWKGRGQQDLKGYILAGNQSRWYVVAFSIMATQASAITFLSTPGQAYVDGMRFVQIYFGLPIAMVLLCMTLVPMYHRLKVYTAYEFLEKRLDLKTRVLTSVLFLIQRGLAAGFTIYAPALILSVILGWSINITTLIMGALVILYTFSGGSKAVSHTQVHQLIIALGGMVIAFVVILRLIPDDVSFTDALQVAGKSGRLSALDFSFDLNNRYTIWSGVLGGLFLSLSYFGTDQSQVQRYLGGRSTGESRIGLLFNGLLKIPMQFFILFVGVMVFVFYQFTAPPVFFNKAEVASALVSGQGPAYQALEGRQEALFQEKRTETYGMIKALRSGDDAEAARKQGRVLALHDSLKGVRKEAVSLLKTRNPAMSESDTNYIFLSFVTKYLPMGLLGIVLAVIFAAAMSSISAELAALSSTSMVDVYRRMIKKDGSDRHYLVMSRLFTLGWGVFALFSAQLAGRMGSLIEAVNIIGSLFYGTILGIFVMAFYAKRVGGTAVFYGALLSEAMVIWLYNVSGISFLWFNAVGTVGVIVFAILLQSVLPARRAAAR